MTQPQNQITVKAVQSAYERCGWKPCRNYNWFFCEGDNFACPVMAIFAEYFREDSVTVIIRARDQHSSEYITGFIDGIDGTLRATQVDLETRNRDYSRGYVDGGKIPEELNFFRDRNTSLGKII